MEITNATANGTMILPAVNYTGAPAIINRFTDDVVWPVTISDEAVIVHTKWGDMTAPGGVVVNMEGTTHDEWRDSHGYNFPIIDLSPKAA